MSVANQTVAILGWCIATRLRLLVGILVLLSVIWLGWTGLETGMARLSVHRAEKALAAFDFKRALEELTSAAAWRPNDPGVWLLASQAARREGMLDEAAGYLKQYRQTAGSTPEGRLESSLLEAQKGDIETNVYELMAKADSGHPATEQILEALAVGSVAIYHFDRAVFWLNQLLERYPANPVGRLMRAQMDDVLGKRERAATSLRALLEEFPENDRAKTLLAGLLYRAQQFEEAAELYGELWEKSPTSVNVLLGLTRCRVRLGQSEEARSLVRQLEERFGDSSEALLEAARFAQTDDRQADAERLLRLAVKLAPNDHEVHYQLGLCLERGGKGEEAKYHLRRFKEVEADVMRLDALLKEVVNHPKDPKPRVEAGQICLRNGQPDESLRWLQGALEIAPNDPATHAALVQLYDAIGDENLANFHRQRAR